MRKYFMLLWPVLGLGLLFGIARAEEEKLLSTPKPKAPVLKVADSKFATSIEDREPVGASFTYPKDIGTIYFWTDIRAVDSRVLPTEVSHVWYLDGEKAAEVALSVKYPRMRTWSSKNILPQEGKWKVEVKDTSGNVLESSTVTISNDVSASSSEEKAEETAEESTETKE